MTVSYYFDKSSDEADQLKELNLDPDNYIAGGLVVMSLNGTVLWSKQLDMTTNYVCKTSFVPLFTNHHTLEPRHLFDEDEG